MAIVAFVSSVPISAILEPIAKTHVSSLTGTSMMVEEPLISAVSIPTLAIVAINASLLALTTTLAANEALLSLGAHAASPYQTRSWLVEKDVQELLTLRFDRSNIISA
ncbi:uncharacterized protein A4U43_UnF4360 [Asparagus officinalis]|uniref:Uncharacterized protein n=1 Tax=Asparagus officinalis TaxID=4686 RepID=A0A1R3L6Y5_ASPOF|nr:uncharacterized protein A4U43_UnF4360 [Asparagus officinalis]